jgi:hypothetical protein
MNFNRNFHSRTVHLDIIKVFFHQLMQKRIAIKGVLKFTLKQLQEYMQPRDQMNHNNVF